MRVRSPVSRILRGALPFLLIVCAWQLLTLFGWVPEVFLPSLATVTRALFAVFAGDGYLVDVWVSVYRVTGAFLLSAALAIPLGLMAGYSRATADVVEPVIGFVRYLPVPAFVPLCILWFGLGDSAKIAVIFLGTFFQLILLVADVARGIPADYFGAGLTLGANRRELIWKILWPASQPGILNASRTALGWAWTYLVVAEIAGATSGVGFRIMQAQRYVETPKVFAGIVIIGLLGMFTDLLFQAYHKWRYRWL